MKSEHIVGYPVASITRDQAIQEIMLSLSSSDSSRYFVCANPPSLEVARKDAEFDLAIRNANLVMPDGVGIVLASKILGGSIRERVTGMDIFLGLSEALNKGKGGRYFFLGSTMKVLLAHNFYHSASPSDTISASFAQGQALS